MAYDMDRINISNHYTLFHVVSDGVESHSKTNRWIHRNMVRSSKQRLDDVEFDFLHYSIIDFTSHLLVLYQMGEKILKCCELIWDDSKK